jgi:AraC family transcriptional regulator
MGEAIRYIVEHLDDPLDPRQVADWIGLSPFHFHRVFQGLLGESVTELGRRLRLERAAVQLQTTSRSITEVAFDAGYATHEAFIKAFRGAFACTPSEMRAHSKYPGWLPTPNGVHFSQPFEFRFVPSHGETNMTVELRDLEPRTALCIAHKGPYYMIGQTFGQLGEFMASSPISFGHGVALFYDDPDSTPADQLRSDAGAFVPDGTTSDDPRVHLVQVQGGSYSVTTYVGSYDGLPAAWGEFSKCELPEGYTYRNTPPFEIYLKMGAEPGGSDSITELYMGLEKLNASD